jgi:hypothetical protein
MPLENACGKSNGSDTIVLTASIVDGGRCTDLKEVGIVAADILA